MAKPEIAPDEGPPPANAKYYDTIKNWIRALSERSYSLASSGAVPIFMGGDHSLSMGSVNGVARYWQEQGRPLFVLWLDAHADYNTPQTTETGNMHGMSAAFLCGESGLDGLLGNHPRASIGPDQLDLFGIRSIDPLEKQLVFERRVAIADMRVDRRIRRRRIDTKDHRACAGAEWRAACQLRCRFSRSHRRARRRHHGAGRRDLSRGASHHGAAARFGSGAVGRYRRAQPVSRRTRPHRARCRRTGQQPVRPADHRPPHAEQRGAAGQPWSRD